MSGGSTSPLPARIADGTAKAADQLSGTLDYRAFVPFLIASIVMQQLTALAFYCRTTCMRSKWIVEPRVLLFPAAWLLLSFPVAWLGGWQSG